MNSLDRIRVMNNEAASLLLKAGDEERAVKFWSKSLSLLKKLLVEPSSGTQKNLSDDDGFFLAIGGSLPPLPTRCSFVYTKVFNIVSRGTSDCCEFGIQLFIACVVFNVAVVHHHKGIQQDEPDFLNKAKSLYQVSLKLLKQVSAERLSATALLLKLVCLNNLSSLYFDEANHKESSSMIEVLLSALPSGEDDLDLFTAEEWDGLLTNAMLVNPPTIAAAA